MQRLCRIFALLLLLLAPAAPAVAGKGDVCRTPDGFVFHSGNGMGGTGIHNGNGRSGNGMGGTGIKFSERKGIGGTGAKFAERNGIGGTGITGDIGVYGRITAFGSICVNGMEIEYGKATPVTDTGITASTKNLKVGQIVAVRAYQKNGEFRARRILIENILSGRVRRLDANAGTLVVERDTVRVNGRARAELRALRTGDTVVVSGLRRADGVIMASHIEKIAHAHAAREKNAAALFGPGVRHFAVQGYVKSSGQNGTVRLTDGSVIRIPDGMRNLPRENDRVIIFGDIDNGGRFIADSIVPERISFPAPLDLPQGLKNGGGLLVPGGLDLGDSPLLQNGLNVLPVIDSNGITLPGTPNIEVPGVPNIDVPGVPNIEVPSIEVPGVPAIEVPVPQLPIIPDLNILPNK